MSRVAITLDEHALAELTRRAQANSEPVSRTAARMVRDGLLSTDAHPAGEPSPPEDPGRRAKGGGGGLPGWLEPPGERERWRRELWATVVGLAERYPASSRSSSRTGGLTGSSSRFSVRWACGAPSSTRARTPTPAPSFSSTTVSRSSIANSPRPATQPPRASRVGRRRQSGLHSRARPARASAGQSQSVKPGAPGNRSSVIGSRPWGSASARPWGIARRSAGWIARSRC